MDYEKLAEQLLEIVKPRGERPPLDHMKEEDPAGNGILRYLMEHDGNATPRELADFFEVSPARITNLLGDLERRGYVCREGNPMDRRRVIVRLTPEGEDFGRRLFLTMRKRVAVLLERLGEEDAQTAVRLTARLAEIAGEQCDEKGCRGPGAKRGHHRKGNRNGKNSEIIEKS